MLKIKNNIGFVYFVFFLSGFSALIYQVVWLRILIRIIGCSVYATSTVLGAFMVGLALGSWLLGRYADRKTQLLKIYAFLESGVGLTALVLPFLFDALVPVFQWTYTLTDGSAHSIARSILVFIILAIPTTLMGGTLPVLSSFLAREKSTFGHRIGSLYGVNTIGAVLGVFGTGFVLLGSIGEFNTVLFGVTGNFIAAAIAFVLNRSELPAVCPVRGLCRRAAEFRSAGLPRRSRIFLEPLPG